MVDDLGLGLDFGADLFAEPKEKKDAAKKTKRQKDVVCLELSEKYLYRRAFSETQLLEVLPHDLKEGHSYHCISGGDVDSLSYLRAVMRSAGKLDYLLFSTWCMAEDDVLQLREWLEKGKIKRLDAYVGEIFPGSYSGVYALMLDVFKHYQCGRVCVFRNHSKIFAGSGENFAFAIESSANINTNPRTEQGVITLNRGLFQFYKDFFDGVQSFEENGTEKFFKQE